jgi:hypothetical protein
MRAREKKIVTESVDTWKRKEGMDEILQTLFLTCADMFNMVSLTMTGCLPSVTGP